MVLIGGPHKWELESNWKIPPENMTGDFYHVADSHASITKLYPGLAESIKMMTSDDNGDLSSRYRKVTLSTHS